MPPTVALVGRYDAGCAEVFDAAVGAHVAEARRGRLALRTGVLSVFDPHVERLAGLLGSQRAQQAELALWDYPGNAPQAGAATEAEWVGHLRTADILLVVVSVSGAEDLESQAQRAVSDLRTELSLLDLMVLETAVQRAQERAAHGPRADRRQARTQLDALQRVRADLESGQALAPDQLDHAELVDLRGFALFGMKPQAVALNVPDELARDALTWLERADEPTWCAVCGGTEAELHTLEPDEVAAFRADLGFATSAAARVGQAVLAAADLITFYTANENAATAWLLPQGATAVEAAGTIHSDLAASFIRADVVPVDTLLDAGGLAALRSSGALRREGREYPVADGDFLLVHFSR